MFKRDKKFIETYKNTEAWKKGQYISKIKLKLTLAFVPIFIISGLILIKYFQIKNHAFFYAAGFAGIIAINYTAYYLAQKKFKD